MVRAVPGSVRVLIHGSRGRGSGAEIWYPPAGANYGKTVFRNSTVSTGTLILSHVVQTTTSPGPEAHPAGGRHTLSLCLRAKAAPFTHRLRLRAATSKTKNLNKAWFSGTPLVRAGTLVPSHVVNCKTKDRWKQETALCNCSRKNRRPCYFITPYVVRWFSGTPPLQEQEP